MLDFDAPANLLHQLEAQPALARPLLNLDHGHGLVPRQRQVDRRLLLHVGAAFLQHARHQLLLGLRLQVTAMGEIEENVLNPPPPLNGIFWTSF